MIRKFTDLKFLVLIVVNSFFFYGGFIDAATWFQLYMVFVGLRSVEKSSGKKLIFEAKNTLQLGLFKILSRETIGFIIASYFLYVGRFSKGDETIKYWVYSALVFAFGNVVSKFELLNLAHLGSMVQPTSTSGTQTQPIK